MLLACSEQAPFVTTAGQKPAEQDMKGSLEPGKLADLVMLDGNPLTVDSMAVRDIQVRETIKSGKTT